MTRDEHIKAAEHYLGRNEPYLRQYPPDVQLLAAIAHCLLANIDPPAIYASKDLL